jgi:alpha-tubulin suppressor-like RCC1 family protein
MIKLHPMILAAQCLLAVGAVWQVSDDFDPGIDPGIWGSLGGGAQANTNANNGGAGASGNSLWFGGDGLRHATSIPFDTRDGGTVSFKIAVAGGFPDIYEVWEEVDYTWIASEYPNLEYSLDGVNFTFLAGYYAPGGWRNLTVPIPAAARSAATRFRWVQRVPSGYGYDHWAIEDVVFNTGPGGGLVNLADAAVESAVRQALGKPTGVLTTADLLQLTALDLTGRGAASLAGLEYAENLSSLEMRGNPALNAAALALLDAKVPLNRIVSDFRYLPAAATMQVVELTATSGSTFFLTVDPATLAILQIGGLGIDTTLPANLAALDAIIAAGISLNTGPANLPPSPAAAFQVFNAETAEMRLDGASSRDIDGTIASWEWSWAGGSTSGPQPVAALPRGSTVVSLTVTDNVGLATTRRFVARVPLPSLTWLALGSVEPFPPDKTAPAFSDYVAGVAGYQFTLLRRQNGRLVVMGADNGSGRMTLPSGLGTVIDASASKRSGIPYCLAVREDGTVAAWGSSQFGRTTVPAGLSTIRSVAASYYQAVALKQDGSVVAWGGSTAVPAGLGPGQVVQIACGDSEAAALKADGTVVTWDAFAGTNAAGNPLPGVDQVTKVALGINNGVALRADGTVVGWGYGASSVPAGLGGVVDIAAGSGFALALKADGSIVTWGDLSYQLDDPPQNLPPVRSLGAGSDHAFLVLYDGSMLFLGEGVAGETTTPRALTGFQKIASTYQNGLAVSDDGTPFSWGSLTPGLTGYPSGQGPVAAVAVTNSWSVILSETGTVVQLGGMFSQPPAGLSGVTQVAAGYDHVLALKSDRNIVGWGNDANSKATAPADAMPALDVAAGTWHSVALRADGTVRAWGLNTNNVLSVPAGLTNVVAVRCSDYHTLALRDNGTVVAWGLNTSGQCNVPAGLADVVAVDASPSRSFALKADGSVVAWGQVTSALANLNSAGNVTRLIAEPNAVYLGYPTPRVTVNFSDAALEAAVRAALGQSVGAIAVGDLSNVTALDFSGSGILNFAGLENFRNLKVLDVRGNPVAATPAARALFDSLPLAYLYADAPRSGALPPGIVAAALRTASGGTVFVEVDPTNLPTLDVSSLDIDGTDPATLAALRNYETLGVTVETGTANLPPSAVATFTIANAAAGQVELDGTASDDLDGGVANWEWSWSGSGIFDASGARVTATLPSGTTVVTLLVTDTLGATTARSIAVEVVDLTEALAQAGVPGTVHGPADIPFDDGVPNLLKYAFNMDLTGSDSSTLVPGASSGLPAAAIVVEDGVSYWQLEYVVRKGSGLTYEPLRSESLDSSSFAPMTGEVNESDIDNEWKRVTVRETCGPATNPRCFSRVRVIVPE